MASTPSFTFFRCYLLVVFLLVGFLFQEVSWYSQLPPSHLIFQCPLQFLVSNLHICWGTAGCSLCSSEDWLGVLHMCKGKCTWVKHLADLLRNRANSQRYSSIYEDWRPKIVQDIQKSDGETIKPGAVKRPLLDPNRGHPKN